jgi:hypothetical protein
MWKANGGGRLPKCKKCGGTIHREEHHAKSALVASRVPPALGFGLIDEFILQ